MMAGESGPLSREQRYSGANQNLGRIITECETNAVCWDLGRRLAALSPLGAPGDNAETRQRVAIYREIRKAGVLPEAAAFALIARTIETAVADRRARLTGHSIAEPATGASNRRRDEASAIAEMFRKYGEEELARLYEHDPDTYARQLAAGLEYALDPDDGTLLYYLRTRGTAIGPQTFPRRSSASKPAWP